MVGVLNGTQLQTRSQVQFGAEQGGLQCSRGGGSTILLYMVGGNEGSSALTVTVVAIVGWECWGECIRKTGIPYRRMVTPI